MLFSDFIKINTKSSRSHII